MKRPLYKNLYALSPEQYVEYALCNLEKASKKVRQFYKDYHTYLSTQRNLFLDELLQSLKEVGKAKKKGVFYRVVLSKYMNDPLCTMGSRLYSGRFNFGNISYDYQSFSCLYISSHPDGAKFEKFPNNSHSLLSGSEMSLIPNDSFLTSRCEINLTKCIDIRSQDSLKNFTKIISKINPTESFQKKWRKMNRKIKSKKADPLKTIKTTEELYKSLFEIYYQ